MSKKPSGSEFRKRAIKKLAEEEKVLQKVPKIEHFFNVSKPVPICGPLPEDNQSDLETKPQDPTTSLSSLPDSCETAGPSSSSVKSPFLIDDPATWDLQDGYVIDTILSSKLKQSLYVDFSNSLRVYPDKKRTLSIKIFSCTLPNGESFDRDWLLYSKTKGCVFCIPCLLFQPKHKQTAFSTGFNDWKHGNVLVKSHEQSSEHRQNVCTFLYKKKNIKVDTLIVTQYESEVRYWREVLTRVVSVVRFLAVRGLPFRGDNQQLGSSSNGLFLGCLELLSEYDSFLSNHLTKYGNVGKGSVSYLSSDTCDEFISIMGSKVIRQIIKEINEAHYFSLIVDSTPDVSHTDQLAVVLRYVSLTDASAKERLVKLLPNIGHKAENLERAVLTLLEELNIDIKNCRGQSYDNASNMSGSYTGLQARIKLKNDKADYVPCAAHSLNLVGVFAVENSCPEVTKHFSLLQGIYTFFSASTYRWSLIKERVENKNQERQDINKITLPKSLSETRWSARADAVRALCTGYKEYEFVLQSLAKDVSQTPESRVTAEGFCKQLAQFDTAFLTLLWNDLLQRIDKTSETLQKEELDLLKAIKYLQALQTFLEEKRNTFDEYENAATKLCGLQAAIYKRNRKRTLFPDEERGCESNLEPKIKFKTEVFLPIIDNLTGELSRRRESYASLSDRFEIFNDFKVRVLYSLILYHRQYNHELVNILL